jgi:hypothetical protein
MSKTEAYWCERHQVLSEDHRCLLCIFEQTKVSEAARRSAVYGDIAASIERAERDTRRPAAESAERKTTITTAVLDILPVIVAAVRDTVYERSMLTDARKAAKRAMAGVGEDAASWGAEPIVFIGLVSKKKLRSWNRVVRLLEAEKHGSNRTWPGQRDIDAAADRLWIYLDGYLRGVDRRRKNPQPDAELSAARLAKLTAPGYTDEIMLGCRALDQIPSGGWRTMLREAEANADEREKRHVGDRTYGTSVRGGRTKIAYDDAYDPDFLCDEDHSAGESAEEAA